MRLSIFSKYKVEVKGKYSYRVGFDDFREAPLGFDQIGMTMDDIIKYLNQLIVENDDCCDCEIVDNKVKISYFNVNTGETKDLELTITEVKDDE